MTHFLLPPAALPRGYFTSQGGDHWRRVGAARRRYFPIQSAIHWKTIAVLAAPFKLNWPEQQFTALVIVQ